MAADSTAGRMFHRIGEVVEQTGIPAHVLRYWESEFPMLKPRKGGGGQRMYHNNDIDLINRIKDLLYTRRFTLEGARKALQQKDAGPPDTARIQRWTNEIQEIRQLLE